MVYCLPFVRPVGVGKCVTSKENGECILRSYVIENKTLRVQILSNVQS